MEKNVELEVLDWGGKGPPLILLTGNGDTAHVFDRFAPLFATSHHVYAVTRRGFGASSAPPPTEENFPLSRYRRAPDTVSRVAWGYREHRPLSGV